MFGARAISQAELTAHVAEETSLLSQWVSEFSKACWALPYHLPQRTQFSCGFDWRQGRGAFRRAYEPARAANVPAHVTLVFGARAISQAELTAHVAEVARRIRPLTPP